MLKLSVLMIVFLAAASIDAKVVTKSIEYQDNGTLLEGFLAYDDAVTGKRPGVLVVHEWYGLNEYAKERARMLAELGYVAFAADIYGKGMVAKNSQEAGELAGKYRGNRSLFRQRLNAALGVLKKQDMTDNTKLAAIGYCFGGTGVLELARSGEDIKGVVSFHGGLSSPAPEDAKNIKCRVLVCHGADDPYEKPEEIAAFQDEMRNGGVDWEMIYYGGAVHGFTNPHAGNDVASGYAYSEKADKRSWEDMQQFFGAVFK